VEEVAQLEAAVYSLRIFQCVDLFLRTNTYAYKGDDVEAPKGMLKRGIQSIVEGRTNSYWYRTGYTKDSKVPRMVTEPSVRIGEKEDHPEEPVDLTPNLDGELAMASVVLVAKPSKLPATTSYGAPSDVPFGPGLLFPYFPGLLSGDSAGFRELVSKLFYRNLGSTGKDLKAAFKDFRAGIGSFPTTSSGKILTHVLKGIELALSTQSHLFLLIEAETYHGFCLLGEKFSVFAHGKWDRPLPAEDLRAELMSIRSHSASLRAVLEALGGVVDGNGDNIIVEESSIETAAGLADALSRVDISEKEEDVEKLRVAMRTLSFPTKFRTFKPQYIVEAISYLVGQESFPEEIPIYLGTDWSKMGTVEYKAFAMFGPRGFSFRNATGTEIKVPKTGEHDPFNQRHEDGKYVYPRLILGEKSIAACISEWEAFVSRGAIKMDLSERASGSRNRVFTEKSRDLIWGKLVEVRTQGLVGIGKEVVPAAEKRSHDVAFGKADFDSITF
jgi:hypothetical protein